MNKLIIIGASGHGKVVADIAKLSGYNDIAFLDDDELLKQCIGYPVIGKSASMIQYPSAHFFVAIGNSLLRQKIHNEILSNKLTLTTLIHPNSVIASDVLIGQGTVVMAGAIINPGSKIGCGCIVNTAATVDHDNTIEDFVHISVGSHLSGSVHVGEHTWISVGAVVSNNIDICSDCTIGAGAVVVKNIKERGVYVGVPARKIK